MKRHFVTNSLSKRDKVITCIVALLLWVTPILSVFAPIPNIPPTASFTMSAATVYVEESVYFDASASFDPDGYIFRYSWDFDDGSGTEGVTTSHSWSTPDTYTVFLTVVDNRGATGVCSQEVEVHALTNPPRRSDELTVNANFLTAYETTWDRYLWVWNPPIGYRWPMTSYSYAFWADDGIVVTRCQDTASWDFLYNAINVDQTSEQGLLDSTANLLSLWYEADVSDVGGDISTSPIDWTGAKFDIKVREPNSPYRDIHMEMYFWKTGANLLWIGEKARHAGGNEWAYQVDLNVFSEQCIQTVDANGVTHFAINVLGLLKRGIALVNGLSWPDTPPSPPFELEHLFVDCVSFCLEAAANNMIFEGPEVHATLHSLRARYDPADVDGDGFCDIFDVVFVASKYGSVIGDELWDFRADLNTDGEVDIFDATYAANHYGEAY